jgi:hypothetical protein
MNPTTRYQAVRDALFQLGPLATVQEVAAYVKQHHHLEFDDLKALSLYMGMVKSKMSRTGQHASKTPSGNFTVKSK